MLTNLHQCVQNSIWCFFWFLNFCYWPGLSSSRIKTLVNLYSIFPFIYFGQLASRPVDTSAKVSWNNPFICPCYHYLQSYLVIFFFFSQGQMFSQLFLFPLYNSFIQQPCVLVRFSRKNQLTGLWRLRSSVICYVQAADPGDVIPLQAQRPKNQGNRWCNLHPRADQHPSSIRKAGPNWARSLFPSFVLYRSSTDWSTPTHITEGNLPYWVHQFKC